jgi:hypothetical protein
MKQVIVEIFDNDKTLEAYEFKSFREITRHKRFQGLDYFQLREVYLHCTGKRKVKKHHHLVDSLIKNMRIFDKCDKVQPFVLLIKTDEKPAEVVPSNTQLH